jgi:hypothetical protein
MSTNDTDTGQVVYWHRQLPPLDADPLGEHVVEASSRRVPGGFAHRDEVWMDCESELMDQVRARLEQEVARLGGRYAHVLSESIASHHNDATDDAWLQGRFTYMLYR